jgi:hypothetical protein
MVGDKNAPLAKTRQMATYSQSNEQNRLAGLDLARFALAGAVVLFHYLYFAPTSRYAEPNIGGVLRTWLRRVRILRRNRDIICRRRPSSLPANLKSSVNLGCPAQAQLRLSFFGKNLKFCERSWKPSRAAQFSPPWGSDPEKNSHRGPAGQRRTTLIRSVGRAGNNGASQTVLEPNYLRPRPARPTTKRRPDHFRWSVLNPI